MDAVELLVAGVLIGRTGCELLRRIGFALVRLDLAAACVRIDAPSRLRQVNGEEHLERFLHKMPRQAGVKQDVFVRILAAYLRRLVIDHVVVFVVLAHQLVHLQNRDVQVVGDLPDDLARGEDLIAVLLLEKLADGRLSAA